MLFLIANYSLILSSGNKGNLKVIKKVIAIIQ